MKNRLLPLIFAFLAVTSINAQKCGTYEGSYEEQVQKFPSFFQGLETLNAELEADYKSALSKMKHLKLEEGKKIIPVVVHVIHNFGNENISDASIQDALDALNRNINGQSDKFLNLQAGNPLTPDIFAAVRGVANVEFRLAKLDPNGNPTTGILRVQSELTSEPENRNAVKGLSYWNSYEYFNIWTLSKFAVQNDGNTLLGFAQFPWSGSMSTDGVVLKAGEMSNVNSTTLTHEAGHWLGLRHTWGDSECGDDGVKDTPIQKYSNGAGENPGPFPSPATFPYHVGLIDGCVADSLNPAGEMYMNFMDYTNDNYVTMFSAGQVDVMNETLDGVYDSITSTSAIGFREYLWSPENVDLTGVTNGFLPPTCSQKADFYLPPNDKGITICDGGDILIKGNKSLFGNANVNSMVWDFGDGSTDNSNTNQLLHTYNGLGEFDVSLTIEYNETLEISSTDLSDLENASSYDSIVEILNIQGTKAELTEMGATNILLHLDLDSLSIQSHFEHLPVDSLGDEHSSSFFGVDTFLLVFYTELGGNITTEETSRLALCFNNWVVDSVITKQNTSTLVWEYDTLTYYFGEYSSDAYDAYFMDTLFYRGEFEQKTYIAYYNNTCTSTTIKQDFISVNATSSSNTTGNYQYSFEGDELTADWHIVAGNSDDEWAFNHIENASWEKVEGVASNGNSALLIDKDNLTLGADELISVAYDLSLLTSPAIKFSWAGASVNNFPVNELNVYYSDNCGETWESLGSLTNVQVANARMYSTNFKPLASEWSNIVIAKPQLKNNNIRFKIEYVTNGAANNFYLDNIMIGEEAELMMVENIVDSRVSIYPNPTSGMAVIELEHLADMNVEVKLVNILGAEVMNLFDSEIVSNYYKIEGIDLAHLETGIYFVKVVANGDVVTTEKLILNK